MPVYNRMCDVVRKTCERRKQKKPYVCYDELINKYKFDERDVGIQFEESALKDLIEADIVALERKFYAY